VQDVLNESNVLLTDLDALAFGRGPGSFTGVRIGIGIAQGLALGAELPMIGVSTLATMAQGAWRKTGATRVLAAIDARMGEVYWAEYQRDEQGVWHGEETEAVLKPEAVSERLQQLEGSWATVGTGWPAWPDLAKDSSLTLTHGEIELPAAEDMLPLACHLLSVGKTVAVELAEPVYLRNNVAWKKLPGRG
jgi:tRNA threonylcarbamoyladenosine biosynthesis protein TsaB